MSIRDGKLPPHRPGNHGSGGHVRTRAKTAAQIRADAVRQGIRKLVLEDCAPCAASYFRLARENGATDTEIGRAIRDALEGDIGGRVMSRRTLLKYTTAGAVGLLIMLADGETAGATPVHVWGFDSVAPVNQQSGCSDNLATAAIARFGTPDFWCRYFKPAGAVSTSDLYHDPEGNVLDNKGVKYVIPISAPGSARIGSTGGNGAEDARTFANDIEDTISNGPHTKWPADKTLNLYLNVENGYYLDPDYWRRWSNTLSNRVVTIGGFEYLPYLPGIYCYPHGHNGGDPDNPTYCQVVRNNGACYSVWSNHPRNSDPCPVNKTPTWNAVECSDPPPTFLWQHALDNLSCLQFCAGTVDLDGMNPSHEGELVHSLRTA